MKVEVFSVQTISENGALCLLLIIEQKNHKLQIMLDCGLNQRLECNHIKHYMNKIQKSKLVLLSQPSIEYAGGLPLISEFQIKTLSTSPIIEFGVRNFVDQLIHLQQAFLKKEVMEEDFKQDWKRILDAADDAYRQIKPLKFGQSETMMFENGLFQVTVCPIRAGKVIGACAWKIQVNTLNIIYITDYNMIKELHIDSLNIERLLIKNQKQSLLQREIVDLLILENYPKEIIQPQNNQQILPPQFFIKSKMEEELSIYHKKQQGQLIFAFYPNERILEGIKSLHQIFKENEKYVGMKWDINVLYLDLVDKARTFGEFLCWDNIQSLNYDNQSKIKSQIILTSYNNLFSGPFYQENLLTDPNNTIIIFDKPPCLINENMGKIRKSFELNLQIKESYSINLNYIRKLLLKTNEKENKLISNAPSTTYLPGSTTDLVETQSVDIGIQKTDDQFSVLSDQKPNLEPLFDKNNYKSHNQLYFIESEIKEQIQFTTAQLDKPLRPMQQLHLRDDYGSDIPKYIKLMKSKRRQQIETQTQQMEEEQDAENEKQKLQESTFAMPNMNKVLNQKIVTVQAMVSVKQLPQNLRNAQMLLEYLNPQNLLILNPSTKPRQGGIQLAVAKQSQAQSLISLNDGQNLPFVEMQEKQIEIRSAIQVKGKLELKIFRNTQTMSQILKLVATQNKKPICHENIQLLALYEELKKRGDLKLELGFCQISLNNGQVIVSKTKQGFKVEGYFSNLYKEVRNLIKTLNI
ncbi:unnamed protein product [Paramecium primaurelia]|uniref:Cleavage and polyadenylation specificity factor subunit 2 n=1 Tax=Paramecium primaurelia TaxID=5886 RepID=A0A8S1LTJ0_PARPR|nr:unnamed protein product [Paramecium primaurelia]